MSKSKAQNIFEVYWENKTRIHRFLLMLFSPFVFVAVMGFGVYLFQTYWIIFCLGMFFFCMFVWFCWDFSEDIFFRKDEYGPDE